jgi:hypothetical protein
MGLIRVYTINAKDLGALQRLGYTVMIVSRPKLRLVR